MKKVSLYVGAKQWQWLKELAETDGRSTSELVRQALAEFLSRYHPPSRRKAEREAKRESARSFHETQMRIVEMIEERQRKKGGK